VIIFRFRSFLCFCYYWVHKGSYYWLKLENEENTEVKNINFCWLDSPKFELTCLSFLAPLVIIVHFLQFLVHIPHFFPHGHKRVKPITQLNRRLVFLFLLIKITLFPKCDFPLIRESLILDSPTFSLRSKSKMALMLSRLLSGRRLFYRKRILFAV